MIAIVTDSTVCMSKREAAAYGVYIIPQNYRVGTTSYKETYSDFFHKAQKPGEESYTWAPEPEDFARVFSLLLRKGYHIICITLSSRLSKAYYNAVSAKKLVGSGSVDIVDSSLTAAGLLMLVKRARVLARTGMSPKEVVGGIYKHITSITVMFSVDDLSGLRKSRRLTGVPHGLGTVLHHRPILVLKNGVISASEVALGGTDRIKKMVRNIPKSATEIIIQYYGKPTKTISILSQLISGLFPDSQVRTRPLGPVLGIHLGAGVIGIIWQT